MTAKLSISFIRAAVSSNFHVTYCGQRRTHSIEATKLDYISATTAMPQVMAFTPPTVMSCMVFRIGSQILVHVAQFSSFRGTYGQNLAAVYTVQYADQIPNITDQISDGQMCSK